MRSLCIRLTLIVLFYLLSWVSNQVFWFAYIVENKKLKEYVMNRWYDETVHVIFLINFSLNPFLYGWTWFEFRAIVIPKLRKVFRCPPRMRPSTAPLVAPVNKQNDRDVYEMPPFEANTADSNHREARFQTLPPDDTS